MVEIASLAPDAVIIGTGGISKAEDVVEMVMAGASAVGLCSLPLKKGLGSTKKLLTDLNELLERLGYNSLAAVKGAFQSHLKIDEFFADGKIILNNKICNNCNLCIKLCPYQAISGEMNRLEIDHLKCHLCGYCVSLCPKGSISLDRNN